MLACCPIYPLLYNVFSRSRHRDRMCNARCVNTCGRVLAEAGLERGRSQIARQAKPQPAPLGILESSWLIRASELCSFSQMAHLYVSVSVTQWLWLSKKAGLAVERLCGSCLLTRGPSPPSKEKQHVCVHRRPWNVVTNKTTVTLCSRVCSLDRTRQGLLSLCSLA